MTESHHDRCDVEFYGDVSRAYCVTHRAWFRNGGIPAACMLATWKPSPALSEIGALTAFPVDAERGTNEPA